MTRSKLVVALPGLMLAVVLVAAGCEEPPPPDPCEDSCATNVAPGTYEVTYEDSSGTTVTKIVASDGTGFLAICGCKKILSDPVLLAGPPDCSRARPAPATLPDQATTFYGIEIEDVAEPDQGRITIHIDSVAQDEPTFGLFDEDRYPDVLTGSAFGSVRGERDPGGNGRVYTIGFTATDDEEETCQGSVTVCVPVVAGGTCTDDGPEFVSSTSPEIDLSVAIADAPDPMGVGENLTYTITVTNNSATPAERARVDIDLPSSNLTIVSQSSACEVHILNTIECEVGRLAGAASTTFTVVITPTSAGNYVTSARVGATSGSAFTDPNSANNTATAQTRVNVSGGSDLALAMTASATSIPLGDDVTYTITATNNGPEAAVGVAITDTLPAGATLVSASPGCTQTSGTVTCSPAGGALAVGADATFTLVIRPTAAGNVSNVANVTSSTEDQDRANNFVIRAVMVVGPTTADLAVAASDSPDPVDMGQPLTYTVTVTNNGPAAADGVVLTDPLPLGVTFVSASASQGSCSQVDGVVTCNLGSVANGNAVTVTIVVTPTASGTTSNTASATSTVTDPVPGNNTATVSTTVPGGASADVSVTNSDSPDPVISGQTLTYTVVVTNNGPAAATTVVLTDTLPQMAEFGTITTTQGTITLAGNMLTVGVGTLASGASATVTIPAFPFGPGARTNSASVTASEADPNSANNSAVATTTVLPPS